MKARHAFFLIFLVMALPCGVLADDIAIYGTQSVTVEPNVLIIFDTSGSMADEVEKAAYDPNVIYSGSYETDGIYYFSSDGEHLYTGALSDSALSALNKKGYVRTRIWINGKRYRAWLYRGNYVNYDDLPVPSDGRPKIDVAKEAVKDLLATTTGVRFGLMEFNRCDGGRIVAPCGTDPVTISSKVEGLNADGGTPLAEALAEAGLYFAGAKPYFDDYDSDKDFFNDTSEKYISPITYRCQKNYIIMFTDGEATCDESPRLYRDKYYNDKVIADYDNDGQDLEEDGTIRRYSSDDSSYGTTRLLDDVAKFLYVEDMNPIGTGTTMVKQNIITHTIGFNVDHDLLGRAASNGGGSYYTADSSSALREAFSKIMSTIAEESSTFVAPVVPVNRQQRTAEGEYIYLAFFKPVQSGDWQGNLKKYGLSVDGDILDASGNIAVNNDGTMKENSKSLWTGSETDGADVLKGGAGEKIKAQATRRFYTYTGSENSLTHSSNLFDESNTDLMDLGVTSSQISEVRGGIQEWPIGSIIHSEPVVVHYSRSSSVIYFGSNDGLFRAIDDATGEELWAFVPPGQLSRLSLLDNTDYDYYVDASPIVSYGDLMTGTCLFEPDTLLVGERRGGKNYYALDITSSTQPGYKFIVDENFLSGAGGEALGQSWGEAASCRVKVSSDNDASVFILPGGYDNNNQDKLIPAAEDSVGRALFAVKVSNGSLARLNVNHGNWDLMSHSIVDLYAVDASGDGITTRVYAGDMGGHVFVVADDKNDTVRDGNRVIEDKAPDGSWSYKNRLFTCEEGKLFYAPVPIDVCGVETLYFGTGNRANPLGDETNRFYAVRNNWYDNDLSDSDLVDVTDESVSYASSLKAKKGWYFEFSHTNEKVVSRALVFSNVVYFTTYTPATDNNSVVGSDPCAGAGARGIGRLYAVSAFDGTSVTTWGKNTKCRYTELSGNLPIAKPVFDGDNVRVGTMKWPAFKDDKDKYFYWKQRP